MYYLPTSCMVLFFLFFLFHPLPCASSKQELGECETLFQCGKTTVGFPYWGGNRRKRCGHPLLELQCLEDNTTLAISNHLYHVLHINQTSNTLRLARIYLGSSFCSSVFNSTILIPQIFELAPKYKSVTVFYHCNHPSPFFRYFLDENCPEIGLISVSEDPVYHDTCDSSFTINVPTSFVPDEQELNLTNFITVLRNGFEVKVKIDKKACQECLRSHERCGFNRDFPLEVKCGPLSSPRKEMRMLLRCLDPRSTVYNQ